MNKCEDSYVQEYNCVIELKSLWADKNICIDSCLLKEIEYLWGKGIVTTGCCCGKHINSPENSSFIGVEEDFIPLMKQLGYQVRFNPCRINDEDSFVPKFSLE